MPLIKYAPWRPDVANLNSAFASDVKNVLLAKDSYIPFPALAAYSTAMDAVPVGGITVKDSTGSIHIFAGTGSKLYKFNSSTLGWDHVSKLAADQVTNGTFAADTDWTKDTGVTIAGGVGVFTTVADGDSISQAQSFTAETIYKVVFTVSGFSAGGVRPVLSGGTSVNGTTRTADGTYTEYLTAVTGNTTFELEAVGETTLNVDNVTVQALENYGASVDERWRFAQFGDYVVAVNVNDDPQVFEVGTSSVFADLGGSPPRARHIRVWGDHLALMNERTVTWSDTDDIANWSTGNSGSQTFPDGGNIQGSNDATNPFIIQENAIRAATFLPGASVVFSFLKIHEKRGAAAAYSICSRGDFMFFAEAGAFFQLDPTGQILPIGHEKVDRTMFGEIGGSTIASIYGEVDPFFTRVYFAVKVNSSGNSYDKLLIYDWNIGEWSQIDTTLDVLFPLASGTTGYTLDTLTDTTGFSLDDLPFSLDSNVWQGGAPVMAAFDTDNKLGFFSGDNAEATIVTQEVGDPAGMVQRITETVPVVDANDFSDVNISIGARMRRTDNVVWSEEFTPSTNTGIGRKRCRARFHRFKLRIAAAAIWTHAQGVNVNPTAAGMR